MKAKIWMQFDKDKYEYGTYKFDTDEQKNRVNDLAVKIREERNCQTYIERIEE